MAAAAPLGSTRGYVQSTTKMFYQLSRLVLKGLEGNYVFNYVLRALAFLPARPGTRTGRHTHPRVKLPPVSSAVL